MAESVPSPRPAQPGFRRYAFCIAAGVIVIAFGLCVAAVWWADTIPQRSGDQQTVVLGQDSLAPGAPAGLRVLVRQANSEQGIKDAQVQVSLRSKGGTTRPQVLYTGRTSSLGTADVQFRVPDTLPADAELVVATASRAGRDEIVKPVKAVRPTRLFLTSDKPVYQPGQTIHIRVLALAAIDMKPVSGVEAQLVVEDAKGNKVFRQAVRLSDYGIAAADFALADEVNQGQYKIAAELGEVKSEKTVTVKWYVLPRFKIVVTTDKPYYLPGETIKGRVQADYFFGKPVAGGEATIVGATYDVGRQQVAEVKGALDDKGGFDFTIEAPRYLTGGAARADTASYTLEVQVVDKANHAEEIAHGLTIAREAILLDAAPESGKLRPGVENIVYVLASYPDGSPAQATLDVTHAGGQLQATTGAAGVAEVRWTPTAAKPWLSIVARDASGRTAQKAFNLEADAGKEQILLRPDRPVYRVGDTMRLEAFVTGSSRTAYLDIVKERQTLLTRAVEVANGKAAFAVDLAPDLFGTLELHAYQVQADGTIVRDTRIVVVNAAVDVDVKLTADKEVYRPGEAAKLAFQISQQGKPVQAALGLAAVDESVFSVEEQDPGFARLYFLLEAELLKPRYQIKDTLAPELLNLPVAAPLEPERAAQGQSALARLPEGRDFTLKANSWPDKVKALQTQQRGALAAVREGLLGVLGGLLLILAALVVTTLALRGLLRGAVKPFLLTLLGLAVAAIVIVPLFYALFSFWRAVAGDSGIVLLLAWTWLLSLLVLGVYAARRRDAAVGVVVLLLLVGTALLPLIGKIVVPDVAAKSQMMTFAAAGGLVGVLALVLLGWGLLRSPPRYGAVSALALPAVAVLALAAPFAVPSLGYAVGIRSSGPFDMAMPAARAPQVVEKIVERPVEKVVSKAPEPTKAPAPAEVQASAATAAQEPPRLRQYFPETLYWNPQAISDEAGRLTLDVPLADSITTWRLSAQASTKQGNLGGLTAGLRVFQDFFVDLDLPVALTQNDEIAAPVSVFNYLAQPQQVRLELKQESWFELLDAASKTLTIGPNDVTVVHFRIRAKEFGRQRLTVTAWGQKMSDAIAREVRVLPDGKEIRKTTSNWLRDGTQGIVRIPPDAIPGSAKIIVKVYPGLFSQIVEGLDGLLRMPFG
jgi:hypothetical protein